MVRLSRRSRQDENVPAFHRFSGLPIELRRKIWTYTLPDPRFHRLSGAAPESQNYSGLEISNDWNDDDGYQLQELMLTLKLICRESCEVFEEHYVQTPFMLELKNVPKVQDDDDVNDEDDDTLIDRPDSPDSSEYSTDADFDYEEECEDSYRSSPSHTYIDLNRDTLRIAAPSMSLVFQDISKLKVGLVHLRYLAIEYNRIAYDGALPVWSHIINLPSVKTLTIVLGRWGGCGAWSYNDIMFEIKDDFTSMMPNASAPWENYLTPSHRTRQLTRYAALANTIKQEYRDLCSDSFADHLRDLEVKVAMHGRILGPCPCLGPTEALFLRPRQAQYSGVVFWAEEPTL